jgi:hypothetical protein
MTKKQKVPQKSNNSQLYMQIRGNKVVIAPAYKPHYKWRAKTMSKAKDEYCPYVDKLHYTPMDFVFVCTVSEAQCDRPRDKNCSLRKTADEIGEEAIRDPNKAIQE